MNTGLIASNFTSELIAIKEAVALYLNNSNISGLTDGNHEHKISRSYLRADTLYPQCQPTKTSLQHVDLNANCASSVKYEYISPDISCDIPYPSQQYNFSQDINVGLFNNVAKSYEHSSSGNHEHKIRRSYLRADML
ncbi:hypothetical protein CEXT_791621 [Caerostris extrusa]|uniref:Uncharacterized protein n=1 Tax=Caerostris extrusa TaxID=172846 RepID=A0AAV4QCJ6_CAEEX|nr:hypothetical protein CEXT_791621 [Caerostris extrusa]